MNHAPRFVDVNPFSVTVKPLASMYAGPGFVGLKVADNDDGTIRVQICGSCDSEHTATAVWKIDGIPMLVTKGAIR